MPYTDQAEEQYNARTNLPRKLLNKSINHNLKWASIRNLKQVSNIKVVQKLPSP